MLTTAMVLETGKGNFDVAIALSVILLADHLPGELGADVDPAAPARLTGDPPSSRYRQTG